MKELTRIGVSPPPPVSLNQPRSPENRVSACGSPLTMSAPTTAPGTEPRPPMITMARKAMETLMP